MIPKIFHQVWTGPPLLPHLEAYRQTWGDLHPDWEMKLWGESDLGWFENQDIYDRAEELAPRNLGQFKANVARIEILYRYGGVYLDCDMEALKPIDPLCDVEVFVGQHFPGRRLDVVATGVLGTIPGHGFYRDLIDSMEEQVERKKGLRSIYTTGVRFVSEVWQRHPEVTVYPAHYFYPYNYDELHRQGESFPDSYAVHHWNNTRSGGWRGKKA